MGEESERVRGRQGLSAGTREMGNESLLPWKLPFAMNKAQALSKFFQALIMYISKYLWAIGSPVDLPPPTLNASIERSEHPDG